MSAQLEIKLDLAVHTGSGREPLFTGNGDCSPRKENSRMLVDLSPNAPNGQHSQSPRSPSETCLTSDPRPLKLHLCYDLCQSHGSLVKLSEAGLSPPADFFDLCRFAHICISLHNLAKPYEATGRSLAYSPTPQSGGDPPEGLGTSTQKPGRRLHTCDRDDMETHSPHMPSLCCSDQQRRRRRKDPVSRCPSNRFKLTPLQLAEMLNGREEVDLPLWRLLADVKQIENGDCECSDLKGHALSISYAVDVKFNTILVLEPPPKLALFNSVCVCLSHPIKQEEGTEEEGERRAIGPDETGHSGEEGSVLEEPMTDSPNNLQDVGPGTEGPADSVMRLPNGDRPFQCNQCGVSFTQKGNLLRHIKLHTGEKPFKCPFCSYACRRRDALTGHLRTHSGRPGAGNFGPAESGTLPASRLRPIGTAAFPGAVSNGSALVRVRSAGGPGSGTETETQSCIQLDVLRIASVLIDIFLCFDVLLVGKPHKCNYCGRSYKQRTSLEEHKERCHNYLQSVGMDPSHSAGPYAVEVPKEQRPLGEVAGVTSFERPPVIERLQASVAKRKSTTPQKFVGEKMLRYSYPDLNFDVDLKYKKEAELMQAHMMDQAINNAISYLGSESLRPVVPHPALAMAEVVPMVNPLFHPVFPIGPHLDRPSSRDALPGPQMAPEFPPPTNGAISLVRPKNPATGREGSPSNSGQDSADSARSSPRDKPANAGGALRPAPRVSPGLARAEEARAGEASRPGSRDGVRVFGREGQELRAFQCEHCRVLFLDHVMYTIHMGCHGYRDPLECNICGHCSKDRYEFSSHIVRGVHTFR
ncbi:hypothetical protein P4O66_015101 [Electrophorus voltai]|uniref:C2H2-type domain-containing protein n=1 Tax=Electrophorus voltai TaxID=2609070 RepID=A0AAD8YY37_9TELE|nr:hypothetical protein P4O66_015101 [Electrophorus voltai]